MNIRPNDWQGWPEDFITSSASGDEQDPFEGVIPERFSSQSDSIGRVCLVSAGGDSYANIRDAATAGEIMGTVPKGGRVKIRGYVGKYASIEYGSELGAHVGKPAFLHVSQLLDGSGLFSCYGRN